MRPGSRWRRDAEAVVAGGVGSVAGMAGGGASRQDFAEPNLGLI
jgi:hypothetical protein